MGQLLMYRQFPQSVNSAMKHAIKLMVPNIDNKMIAIIVVPLVGMFGHTLAGDVYSQCGTAIDNKHNLGLEIKHSVTYIDDAGLIDSKHLIDKSIAEYIEHVETVFGNDNVINTKKVKKFENGLICIGWEFDFVSWTVRTKDIGLAKNGIPSFVMVPVGTKSVLSTDLEILTVVCSGHSCGEKFRIIIVCLPEARVYFVTRTPHN